MSSIFLWGPPGGGKTTLAASLTDLGYRVKFYDVDHKIPGMQNLKHLLEEGKIEVVTPQARLTEATLKARVLLGLKGARPTQQPQGYLELVDFINELEEDPPEDHDNVVPVIDSLSLVLDHLTRLILFIQNKNIFTFDEYKFLRQNLEELFDSFYALTPSIYPHCVMTGHDMIEKDENTGKIKVLPSILGSFREKVGAYVSEMYYCATEADKNDEVNFYVQTKPVGEVQQARSSHQVDTYMPASFKEIFKRK